MKPRTRYHIIVCVALFLPRLVYGLMNGETAFILMRTFGLMVFGYVLGVFLLRITTNAFTRVNF